MMQQLIRRSALLACLIALFGALTATADSLDLGMTVTPGKFEASIPLGTTYNIPVTVANTAATPLHVLASMTDFGVAENGDYQFEKVGTRPYSLLRWAAIRPREFDLPPGTSQQVQLTISIPSDAQLNGEYAGIIFFQTRPERRAGTGYAFSERVASKFYITIPNTVKVDGAIVKMTSVKGGGDEIYRVLFKNIGNAHEYLRGQLTVQKGGAVVYQVPMPDNMLVERGGERLIELKGKGLEPGTYQAIATIDYGGKTETGGEINFDVR
ncbi:MAG TPA: hypothetical protein VMF11_06240 [Candidatus Baltobacteraceae bacterium]|nr:hypothetical protein [Candidatus Baltobacteraceae bacterium]